RRHTRFSRDWSSDVCSSDLFWVERRNSTQRELDPPDCQIFGGRCPDLEKHRCVAIGRGNVQIVVPSSCVLRMANVSASYFVLVEDRKSVVQGRSVGREGGGR